MLIISHSSEIRELQKIREEDAPRISRTLLGKMVFESQSYLGQCLLVSQFVLFCVPTDTVSAKE